MLLMMKGRQRIEVLIDLSGEDIALLENPGGPQEHRSG